MTGRGSVSLVQGAVIAALLGAIAGELLVRMDERTPERRAEPTQVRRTIYAIARAQLGVLP